MEKKPAPSGPRPSGRAILIAIGLALLLAGSFVYFRGGKEPLPSQPEPSQEIPAMEQPPENPEPQPEAPGESAPSIPSFPTDKLFITAGRQGYASGELRLVIPKLELDVPIQNGVDEATLKEGPGLYDYAQLPSKGNSNVSIAGHRDIYGSHFYYVDTLAPGDLFYLVYHGEIYQYAYYSTQVVEADDWGPIYSKEFSALTLTSCTPIGTSLNRIIITAKLVSVVPETEEFDFRGNDPAYAEVGIGESQPDAA